MTTLNTTGAVAIAEKRTDSYSTSSLRRDERGISLVEMLITMLVFAVIMALVSGFFITAMRSIELSRDISNNTKAASNAINALSRALRAASPNPDSFAQIEPAFQTASGSELTFFTQVNLADSQERPAKYRFWVDKESGQLRESVWRATQRHNGAWQFPPVGTEPESTRLIAEVIAPTEVGGHPFSYVLVDGSELAPKDTALTREDRARIAAVRVTLNVQQSTKSLDNQVTLTSLVGMTNLIAEKLYSEAQ